MLPATNDDCRAERIGDIVGLPPQTDDQGVEWIDGKLLRNDVDDAFAGLRDLAMELWWNVTDMLAVWVPDEPDSKTWSNHRPVDGATFEEILLTQAIDFCRRNDALRSDKEIPDRFLWFRICSASR